MMKQIFYSDEINEICINTPAPGDYWSEHLVGICVVVAIIDDLIFVCKKKKTVPELCWTWDLDHLSIMTHKEFKNWLSYKTMEGCWADCSPTAHSWVTDTL